MEKTSLQKKEERGQLVHEMELMTKTVAEEKRDWTNEESAKFDKLEKQQEQLRKEVESAEREERVSDLLTRAKNPESNITFGNSNRVTNDDRELALRAFCLRASGNDITDEMTQAADKCGVNLQANSMNFKLTNRAQTNTSAEGGYTHSDSMVQGLEQALKSYGGMRSASRILRTQNGNDIHFAYNDDTANVGAIVGENTNISNTSYSFSKRTLKSYKYVSGCYPVSLEILQDSEIPIAGFISEGLGTRLARIQNTHFTVGTGTAQPFGVVTDSTQGFEAASATALTYNDLVSMFHSVDASYRNNAVWMLSDSVWASIKKLVDSNGLPLFGNRLGEGVGDTLLGKKVVVNNDMASTLASDAKIACFGDFSKYIIRDVADITVRVLNERFADDGSVGFIAYSRADGKLINSDAVKHLKMAT